MRRKFISALLFGVLLAGSTSTLVSCKDYDDDIASLRTEITTNATTLESMVTEKTNNLQTLINALQTEDTKLSNELTQAKTDLTAAIATAKSEANNYADVQAAAARVAAIEAAQTEVANAKAQLQAAIDDSNSRISALESKTATQEQQIAALVEADAALQTAINTAKAEVAQAAAQAQTAADNAQAAADAAQATANTNAENLKKISEDLTNVQTSLQSQITVLSDKVTALQTTVAENKAAVDAQLKTVTSSIESNAAAIEALKTSTAADKTELLEKIAANTAGLTELSTKLAALQTVVDANLTEAKNYADTQVAALEAKLGTDIKDIQVRLLAVETLSKTNAEKIAAAEESIKKLQSADDEISKKLDQAIEDAKATHNSLLSQIATVSDNLDALSKDVDAVKTSLEGTQTQLETLDGYVNGIMTQNLNTAITDISSIKEELATLTQSVKDYIEANDEAITKLQINLISGYNAAIEAEATTLRSELSTAVSGLESNISDLKKTLEGKDAELQKQINDIQKSITELKGDNGEISSLQSQIDELVAELEKAFGVDTQTSESKSVSRSSIGEAIANMKSTIEKRLNGYDKDIQDLKDQIKTTAKDMDDLQNLLQDQINELLGFSKQLKALVFNPEEYYQGIEAIGIYSINYYAVEGLDLGKGDVTKDQRETIDQKIKSNDEKTTLVPFAQASYYLNPSNAKIDTTTASVKNHFSYIVNNAVTRAKTSGDDIDIDSVRYNSKRAGLIDVYFSMDTKAFKNIADGTNTVDVAALRYSYAAASGDTVITSDFAALKNYSIGGFVLNKVSKIDAINEGTQSQLHLYKTAAAAIAGNVSRTIPVAYNAFDKDGLDLNRWINVHCNMNGKTDVVWGGQDYISKYNMKLEYELIGYINEANKTNESSHATIIDGHILSVHKAGKEEAAGKEIVGRRPLIRVIMRDLTNNQVVTYGYICAEIVSTTDEVEPVVVKPVAQNDSVYYLGCADATVFEYTATWDEIEENVLAKLNMSKNDFENTYRFDGLNDNNNYGQINVYVLKDGEYVSNATYGGNIYYTTNAHGGHATNLLTWKVNGNQAYNYFMIEKESTMTVYAKLIRKSEPNSAPVYLEFNWTPSDKGVKSTIDLGGKEVRKASAWIGQTGTTLNGYKNEWYVYNQVGEATDKVHAAFDNLTLPALFLPFEDIIKNQSAENRNLSLAENAQPTFKFAEKQPWASYTVGDYVYKMKTNVENTVLLMDKYDKKNNLIDEIKVADFNGSKLDVNYTNEDVQAIINSASGAKVSSSANGLVIRIETEIYTCSPSYYEYKKAQFDVKNNTFLVKVVKPVYMSPASTATMTLNNGKALNITGSWNLSFVDFTNVNPKTFYNNCDQTVKDYFGADSKTMYKAFYGYYGLEATSFKMDVTKMETNYSGDWAELDPQDFTLTVSNPSISISADGVATFTATLNGTQMNSNMPSQFKVRIPVTAKSNKFGTLTDYFYITVEASKIKAAKRY